MEKITVWKIVPEGNTHTRLERVQFQPPPSSLNSASERIPAGVYTTFRTYARDKILPLEYQIWRLEDSARLLGFALSLEESSVRKSIAQAIASSMEGDTRIRLTVDLEEDPGTLYLALEPLRVPSAAEFERGAWVATCRMQRENPQAKQTAFISIAKAIQQEMPEGVSEGLLVDEQGRFLEGLSSNFFAVKDGVIWTAEEGVLAGITRSLLIDAAGRENLPVRLEAVNISDLPSIQEAFLTSSSRSVLPIRQIDTTIVGEGIPGPVTRRLARLYQRELETRLVPLGS